MKTQTFIAKTISAILCLDRYSNLIHHILDHFSANFYRPATASTKQIDNNYIDGILHVLNCLVQRHGLFRLIDTTDFFSRLRAPNLDLKLSHCPINYMNYLRLLTRIYCLNRGQFTDNTRLAELIGVKSGLESIDSFTTEHSTTLCLQKPGSHHYLCQLGYSLCILLEARSYRSDPDTLEKTMLILMYNHFDVQTLVSTLRLCLKIL